MRTSDIPSAHRAIFTSCMNNCRSSIRLFLSQGVPGDLTHKVVVAMFGHSIRTAGLGTQDETLLLTLGTAMIDEAVSIETCGGEISAFRDPENRVV